MISRRLIILFFAFLGCIEDNSIHDKPNLSISELLKITHTNSNFQKFVENHSYNILRISDLSENEISSLADELENLLVDSDQIDQVYSIMKRYNLSTEAYTEFLLFNDFLNSNFIYNSEDLIVIIQEAIEIELSTYRINTFMPPALSCTTVCTIHAAAVKQHWIDSGFSNELAGALGAQAYTSCMYGCTYEF
jgi:hypothetical protein